MTIIHEYEDGKIICIYDNDGWLKAINVVSKTKEDAEEVSDFINRQFKTIDTSEFV